VKKVYTMMHGQKNIKKYIHISPWRKGP